ncbi:MAG: hypothetical protein RLZZ496_1052, partial [Pseudomonadota bacterium]
GKAKPEIGRENGQKLSGHRQPAQSDNRIDPEPPRASAKVEVS